MGMWSSTAAYDGIGDVLKTCTRLWVCSSQPSTYSDASSSGGNANLAFSSALSTASFTLADSTASGRKVTVAQQSTLGVATSGVASHVAIGTTTDLYYVTTCTTKALGGSDSVTVPAWAVHTLSPTSST
jgi:hypothetical protein